MEVRLAPAALHVRYPHLPHVVEHLQVEEEAAEEAEEEAEEAEEAEDKATVSAKVPDRSSGAV